MQDYLKLKLPIYYNAKYTLTLYLKYIVQLLDNEDDQLCKEGNDVNHLFKIRHIISNILLISLLELTLINNDS